MLAEIFLRGMLAGIFLREDAGQASFFERMLSGHHFPTGCWAGILRRECFFEGTLGIFLREDAGLESVSERMPGILLRKHLSWLHFHTFRFLFGGRYGVCCCGGGVLRIWEMGSTDVGRAGRVFDSFFWEVGIGSGLGGGWLLK
jgi:hypothetical protein